MHELELGWSDADIYCMWMVFDSFCI